MPQINLKILPDKSGIYLVGGTVRDRMLGRPTADCDLAVVDDALGIAEYIAAALGSRVVRIGRGDRFIYRIVAGAQIYDVSQIQGKDIISDLLRRDFTINSMGMDARTGEIFDPAGGRKDLDARLVRMVSAEAFDADPLRMLRAFRMAAVLGFSVEDKTIAAIAVRPDKIGDIAGERIREEWLKMLEGPDSSSLLIQIHQTGLLNALFPEIEALAGCTQNQHHTLDAFDHTMAVYRLFECMIHENDPPLAPPVENRDLVTRADGIHLLKHAALFHDIGKPRTRSVDESGVIHFYGHESAGAEMAGEISRRMRFSNAQNAYVVFLIRNHLRPLFLHILDQAGKLRAETVTRFFMKTAPWTPDLLLLSAADMGGKKPGRGDGGRFLDFARGLIDKYHGEHLPAARKPPLITGHDLIRRFGLPPSPEIARILRKVEEKRLAGRLENREQALAAAAQMIGKSAH